MQITLISSLCYLLRGKRPWPHILRLGWPSITVIDNQGFTKQLRGQETISKGNGFRPELRINKDAKISKPLQNSSFDIITYGVAPPVIDNTIIRSEIFIKKYLKISKDMTTNTIQENIDRLRTSIIDQATAFLKDAGEFYPFGSAIKKNSELSPVGVYFGKEYPDSNEVIRHLAEALWTGIVDGSYQIAAMGVDVYIRDDNPEGKSSAIEIRIFNEEGIVVRYYQPYKLTSSNDPIYGQMFAESE
ncbi:hypothetical protein [Chitinophaga sp. S165]|uniref:hypothetical protein n=1 Tax=Chitinophaga sp. S165 TaxID=2135462 RepID=UPI000D710AE7|nr:hypothetical protein [Chitinophaga sp. S165]PWV45379.1 hypothetical protein C7475_11442 [Chitinophaga sp. S165]